MIGRTRKENFETESSGGSDNEKTGRVLEYLAD